VLSLGGNDIGDEDRAALAASLPGCDVYV
jgi:hypothetical protein